MKVGLAQINSVLGGFKENRQKIIRQIKVAQKSGVDLVVFPEAALFGYHPVDLLERESVVEAQIRELKKLSQQIPEGMGVLVGAITRNQKKTGKPFHNSAVFLKGSKVQKVFPKQLLPTYDVFDEGRHIEPGHLEKNIIRYKGKKILVTICEDIWGWSNEKAHRPSNYLENPIKKLRGQGIDLVVNLSASPFTVTKMAGRLDVVSKTAKFLKAATVYTNMVGGQDELIFDGGSFAVDASGKIVNQAKFFVEDFLTIDFSKKVTRKVRLKKLNRDEFRFNALVLGLRDFVHKTGFQRVHLGLSGGIDSAVVAAIAFKAVGPENLHCIALPGPFNAPKSLSLAKELCENLGANWHEMQIEDIYNSSIKSLRGSLGDFDFGLTNENAQARARCLLLMAFSNLKGSLLLNPSNKSEFAMGYSTLYGDLSGGISVIGDLLKTEVYNMAEFINSYDEVIPSGIIDRAPSAELRPNQKDSDSLPPYEKLDKVVEKLVEHCKPAKTALEKRVLNAMMKSEFKRWQAPPILKVSDHAFGRGRRLPVAHKALL